jgi:hypothetical protein
MVSSQDCLTKYGLPANESNMVLWPIPPELTCPAFPKKIYCNKDLIEPLKKAFKLISERSLASQVKSWNGCFAIRKKRGNNNSFSLHSWGVAIDINAPWNGFGKTPTMSKELVACFVEAGFEWGGNWKKPDGMHFQLAKI